jgi:hypothetical protein
MEGHELPARPIIDHARSYSGFCHRNTTLDRALPRNARQRMRRAICVSQLTHRFDK